MSLLDLKKSFMERAICLGQSARFVAPPNPWVGCVIVKEEQIIGEGSTGAPGTWHAETHALKNCTQSPRNATAYVTLEPCNHQGRTGPCTRALVQAGISHVVVATEDPDPRVQGQGIDFLRQAGVQVDLGLCQEEVQRQLRPYLHQRKTKRTFCHVKAAISMDGRIAAKDGSSQWISCEAARRDAHELRDLSQAIAVGSKTALNDGPALTIRHVTRQSEKPPLRVLLDRSGSVPATGPLFDNTLAPTLVLTKNATQERREEWVNSGVEVAEANNLKEVLLLLGSRGILSLLLEGGSTLFTQAMNDGVVDLLTLYVGPKMLGKSGIPIWGREVPSIEGAPTFRFVDCKNLGQSVRLDYLNRSFH